MKKGNLIFNAIILISITVLYILHFTQGEDKSSDKITNYPESTISGASSSNIVYIDLQKLLIEYKLAEQLNIDFIKRKGSLQDQLDSQIRSYEKDAIAFQEKLNRGNFLSQQSAENQQNKILKRQQELQQLQYDLEDQLYTEQQNLNTQLFDSVINYLNEYNKTHNHQYILSKVDGSNLLVADTTYDITVDILSVLNERYTSNFVED